MFRICICLGALIITILSEGVCRRSEEVPCAGTCTERLAETKTHGDAAKACQINGKKTYMGSRTNEEMESTCSRVVGELDSQYIWSRYKLRGGLVVDEEGRKIDRINWGLQYCGGVDQSGQFFVHPCSWTKYAICVTNVIQYDKDQLKKCNNEYYWVTDQSQLNYKKAVEYCKSNNMKLVTPYTTSRKTCISTLMQTKSFDAWIDYNITSATQSIEPWDLDYCIKVNIRNSYTIDRCSTKLPVTCTSFGELKTVDDVVQKGNSGSVSCRCYNCTVDDIEWTDGITVWRSNTESGDVSVTAVPDSSGVNSVLTVATTTIDQVFTCTRTTPFTGSVVYQTATIDVYDLAASSHFISYGDRITLTCDFNNDKHLDMQRVEWLDLRDGNNMTGRAKTTYRGNAVLSTLEINSEFYTHDVRCTFHTAGSSYPYTGTIRIIVYKIIGGNSDVPANSNTTLTCNLREHEGNNANLVPPTRVDWLQGTYVMNSEVNSKYMALLRRNMRTGVDRYTCRFLFTNGDVLSKTLTVTAFNFEGVSAHVANGTTGRLKCSYSEGSQPQEPLWWEREGVRITDGKAYRGEIYRINSNYMNETYFKAWTEVAVQNASYSADYQCCLKVTGKVWRKQIFLNVFPGDFIASNVTILEEVDSDTGEIIVSCVVWAFPRPSIQLFIDTLPDKDGDLTQVHNKTMRTTRIDRTCEPAQIKCLAANTKGTREIVMQSKKAKNCGFFAKLSLMYWAIIGGVLLLLILIILIICCCFCRKTKKLKEEVEYQREVLSTVEGASTMYSMNLSRGKGKQFEDMYDDHNYDPLVKHSMADSQSGVMYHEPYSEVPGGLMSPKYQRIESDYEPHAPLFTSRSKSRDNMTRSRDNVFSPPLMKKSAASLSYQNLKEGERPSPMSRSATNINRKFAPVPNVDELPKMNPFGNVQRLRSEDADEVQSITSRIPPSEVSGVAPPVAVMSPRGWEIPAAPAAMFSPPLNRRPRQAERKFSEPTPAPSNWVDPREKVENWNLPPTAEEMMEARSEVSDASTFKKPGSSTDYSSSVLDSISITPMYPNRQRPFSPVQQPGDRIAYCSSPPPVPMYDKGRQRNNIQNNVFDIDDLSSVDVPDGTETLARRIGGAGPPPAENFYTPQAPPPRDYTPQAPPREAQPQKQGAFPSKGKEALRTSHF